MAETGQPFELVFMPLTPLFLDALTTLIRRHRRGERLSTPHRLHLYQRLARSGWGHARVSVLFGLAAGVGTVLPFILPGVGSWSLALGYGAVLVVMGALLDRIAPFPPPPSGRSDGAVA